MYETLSSLNPWGLIFLGVIVMLLEVLLLKRWLKVLGLSLCVVGAISWGFDVQSGWWQLFGGMVLLILFWRLTEQGGQSLPVADEHPEGGIGEIIQDGQALRVIYKERSWPIVTDEPQLQPGDRVVVLQIDEGFASVELLSRKSIHAKN
ncbi:MAG: hypothetical protein JXR44_03375 [Thiotrichales bacterium]|nr:hypothetical protein [Thiotrichales bacterium]